MASLERAVGFAVGHDLLLNGDRVVSKRRHLNHTLQDERDILNAIIMAAIKSDFTEGKSVMDNVHIEPTHRKSE